MIPSTGKSQHTHTPALIVTVRVLGLGAPRGEQEIPELHWVESDYNFKQPKSEEVGAELLILKFILGLTGRTLQRVNES